MNSQNETEIRHGAWQRFLKWMRIVPRRRYRLLRSSLRRWNKTKGEEWRDKTRQTSSEVAERAREEVAEFRTDTRQRYEQARPQIEQMAQDGRERAVKVRTFGLRWLRFTASVLASIALFASIGAIIFFLSRDTDSTNADLTCELCPAFSVTRIIDGDKIDTSVGRIRIYGADTPERGEQCFSEATAEMHRLAGSEVRGERGPRFIDPFGRNLYYVYTESGDSIDELLIRNGFAVAWTQDGQHRTLLVDAESTARRDRVGCLWK